MGFICPVCKNRLLPYINTYRCKNGHSFDLAKSGYVNLLLNNAQGRHGDDKLMVKARTVFLEKGYYLPLAEKITEIAEEHKPETLIDAGCGEGYYTEKLSKLGYIKEIIGIDISKEALKAAAKRKCGFKLAVGSTSDMPVESEASDMLINVFSPFFGEEFRRVLKKGGYIIRVIPLEKHLHELRCAIYDKPYDNIVPKLECEGFDIIEKSEIKYELHLDNNEDIMSLFSMTPYYYKTSREDQAKAEKLTELKTGIEFGIIVYKKRGDKGL